MSKNQLSIKESNLIKKLQGIHTFTSSQNHNIEIEMDGDFNIIHLSTSSVVNNIALKETINRAIQEIIDEIAESDFSEGIDNCNTFKTLSKYKKNS